MTLKYRFSLLETAFYTPKPDQTGIDIFVDRISGGKEPTALQFQENIHFSQLNEKFNRFSDQNQLEIPRE